MKYCEISYLLSRVERGARVIDIIDIYYLSLSLILVSDRKRL